MKWSMPSVAIGNNSPRVWHFQFCMCSADTLQDAACSLASLYSSCREAEIHVHLSLLCVPSKHWTWTSSYSGRWIIISIAAAYRQKNHFDFRCIQAKGKEKTAKSKYFSTVYIFTETWIILNLFSTEKWEKNSKNIKSVRGALFTVREVNWIFLQVR